MNLNRFLRLLPFLFCLFFLSSCFSLFFTSYPPTEYDPSKKWLSHYEDNYFVKVPTPYKQVSEVSSLDPALQDKIQKQLDQERYVFSQNAPMAMGVFRSETSLNSVPWSAFLRGMAAGQMEDHYLAIVEELIEEMGVSEDDMKHLTYQEFQGHLLISLPPAYEVSPHLQMAIQSYSLEKGGDKETLFIAYTWAVSPVSTKMAQNELEALLDNTVLSYFLNYERTLKKNLIF